MKEIGGHDQILASLKAWQVPYLDCPPDLAPGSRMEPGKMAAALITSAVPRIRLAAVAFYLRHPEESASVHQALKYLKEPESRLLKSYYTAAVYLEHYWKTALNRGRREPLHDYFSKELGLPDPSSLHGRLGLFQLEEKLQNASGAPFDYRSIFDAIAALQIETAHA